MLRETIIYAYTYSPFYRWFYNQHNIDVHSIQGLQNYESLPILRKEDLLSFAKKNTIEKSWCIPYYKNFITATTTGTTEQRLKVLFSQTDIYKFVMKPCIDCLNWWGYESDPINVITWEHSQDSLIAIWLNSIAKETEGKRYLAEEVEDDALEFKSLRGATMTFVNLPTLFKYLDSPFLKRAFKKLNLKYIFTLVTPSELKKKFHVKIATKIKGINLIPVYGFTEGLFVGASCPYTFKNAYIHIIQPGLFHIIDHNGILRKEGKGQLLYTSLCRKAFPFIKYSMGDIVTLKEVHNCCNCGYSGMNIRFETRFPLTVKIRYANGYFIDIIKVVEIIKEMIPESQIICVYGENIYKYYLFLAIFIGISKSIADTKKKLKDKITKNIILNHVPTDKINEIGLSDLILEWCLLIPIFFIDVADIPIESGVNKPRLLLNLIDEKKLLKSKLYKNILSKLQNYLY